MKKGFTFLFLAVFSLSAHANFFGSNNDFFGGSGGQWKQGPYGYYYEENNWPEWTPMYWMEEFMNEFDDNNNFGGYGNNWNMPFFGGGNNMPYYQPYGGYGYGGSMPNMPYGFGGNYPAYPAMPYSGGYPYPMPYYQMPPQQSAPK